MNTRIKEVRKSLNLTLKNFAKNLNLSESHLSNLEKGRGKITARNIEDICYTYNVNKEWLENGSGEMFVKLTSDDEFNILVGKLSASNDSFKKKVIKEMLKLDDEDWIFIEKFFNKLK